MMRKNKILCIALFIFVSIHVLPQGSKKKIGQAQSPVSDIDGNVYKTVKIGSQIWMAENLRVTSYRNGEPIVNVYEGADWAGLTTGGWCDYNNDAALGQKYGKLYNWYAVNDARNIAPLGWHIATDAEWVTLTNLVTSFAGTSFGAKALSSVTDWATDISTGSVGNNLSTNNSSLFNALPGGYRYSNGPFYTLSLNAYWWSSTQCDVNSAYYVAIYYCWRRTYRSNIYKQSGLAVRCVKDK